MLDQVPVTILQGPLLDEVHQNINSWIYQVITLTNIEEFYNLITILFSVSYSQQNYDVRTKTTSDALSPFNFKVYTT